MATTTLVADIMSRDVKVVAPDTLVPDAADLLAEARVGAMPVVDADGRLVGLLRDEDLIVSEARLHVPTFISFLGGTLVSKREEHRFEEELRRVAGSSVADVMQAEPPTIRSDATVEDAATLMHRSEVTHVPVLDSDGRVVGMLARGDLVRFIARTT